MRLWAGHYVATPIISHNLYYVKCAVHIANYLGQYLHGLNGCLVRPHCPRQQAKRSSTYRFETPAMSRRFLWVATGRHSLRALAWPQLAPTSRVLLEYKRSRLHNSPQHPVDYQFRLSPRTVSFNSEFIVLPFRKSLKRVTAVPLR